MCSVWNAPATCSAMTRARAGGRGGEGGEGVERAGRDHLAAAVDVRGDEPVRRERREDLVGVAAEHRAHAGGVAAAARAIAAPRTATRRRASSSVSTPAIAAAASSPTECPAVTPTSRCAATAERRVGAEVEDGPQARQRGGHEQRLRDGGVPDGVGVGRGAVGDQVEARGRRGPRDRLGDGRQLEPGGEHAGGLGTLTGADDDEHPTTLPGRAPPPGSRRAPTFSDALCVSYKRVRAARRGRPRRGGVEPTERQGRLQDVRLARVQTGPSPVTSATRLRR